LLNAVHGQHGTNFDTSLKSVIEHFGDDIEPEALSRQLQSLQDIADTQQRSACQSVVSISQRILQLGNAGRICFSQIDTLIKLFLLLPVTSATAERSFSALRRLKTYLRSTMGQSRLNHTALLQVHQDVLDKLNVLELAEQFILARDNRRIAFGHFV
jgi:hAT family C-terminal dimerisation region